MDLNYFFDNKIEAIFQVFNHQVGQIQEEILYQNIEDKRVRYIFATFQREFNNLFGFMNEKFKSNSHFNAEPSRELVFLIKLYKDTCIALKETKFNFSMLESYQNQVEYSNKFLSSSRGSGIPEDYTELELIEYSPIINLVDVISKKDVEGKNYPLKLIGTGSYATVKKFKDLDYNEFFAVKQANKDLTSTEIERFKKEFKIMKSLDSPYLLKVYKFNNDKNEFIMEYVKDTLEKFIKTNPTLSYERRINLCNQLFVAFKYLHNKEVLHRDISLSNILVKTHEDGSNIIKICDFGYYKEKDSTLTKFETLFQGSMNDPALKIVGPSSYDVQHEIYALTQVLYFVMTGRVNLASCEDETQKEFIKFGMDSDLSKRAKSLNELEVKYRRVNWKSN